MNAYYNEIEPYPAAWLRNLAGAGHIADGVVDGRSIVEVQPADLAGSTQCHFFAGVGVWSYALRLAGVPDTFPAWTGSCPCQPFSAAGKRGGFDDSRHLWPEWFRLIRQCRPPIVLGEQVASPDGLKWLDAVRADMEGAGYAFGAADLAAAGVGAPHRRARLWFVAHASGDQRGTGRGRSTMEGRAEFGRSPQQLTGRGDDGMADPEHGRREEPDLSIRSARQDEAAAIERGASHWSAADWIPCADGAKRPVEPGLEPVVDGAPARVGRLRAYGNAIVPQVAAQFIRAAMTAGAA